MKKKIIIAVCGIAIGFIIGAIVYGKYKQMVDKARVECIEYNKKHNEIFQIVAKNYLLYENEKCGIAASVMQETLPLSMAICKALEIDCRMYDEKGDVVMAEQKNGEKHPMEMLPNELRIMK